MKTTGPAADAAVGSAQPHDAPASAAMRQGTPATTPAFPVEAPHSFSPGMSIRDWFAGQALIGIVTSGMEMGPSEDPASLAYRLADAMLERRSMKP